MDKYFTEDFKSFFNSLDAFGKKLVLWSSVDNSECPYEHYLLVLESVEKYNKNGLKSNYYGNRTDKKVMLKPFTPDEEKKLKRCLEELDGTLLSDIFSKSLQTHKIFK
jgi:hypothetical protein